MTLCFGSYGQAIKKAKKYPKTNMAVAGILLSLITDKLAWISAREKKGVCHFLVKDGELKWVVDDG